MPIITVEKPLKDKLGDEAVDSLIRLINESQTEQKAGILEFVEEKFERRLTTEIGKVNERMTQEISKLDIKIENTRADLIKWMFIFWIGQVAALLGILFAFFK
ncbi:DUF1640 domain-containing protein [candidate division KSB1 bacterium]|nr:DUF1640 domain-containing protein [candidate division KSB1 bacterium]